MKCLLSNFPSSIEICDRDSQDLVNDFCSMKVPTGSCRATSFLSVDLLTSLPLVVLRSAPPESDFTFSALLYFGAGFMQVVLRPTLSAQPQV